MANSSLVAVDLSQNWIADCLVLDQLSLAFTPIAPTHFFDVWRSRTDPWD